MENTLYKEVYAKITQLKTVTTLGELATFLHQQIVEKHPELPYDIISDRTLERGFKSYLHHEILQKFEKKSEQKQEKPYKASLKTLNLLAEYLEHKDFAEFSHETLKNSENNKEKEAKERDAKITFTVHQTGENNTAIREIRTDNLYL